VVKSRVRLGVKEPKQNFCSLLISAFDWSLRRSTRFSSTFFCRLQPGFFFKTNVFLFCLQASYLHVGAGGFTLKLVKSACAT
jgi:hypothetical protein